MKRHSQGFSIIEVLVSLVLFAIGILGLTGMYLSALKAQADAKARSGITAYTSSMMDRIAANTDAANAYNLSYGSAAPTAAICSQYKPAPTSTSPVTPYSQFAQFQSPLAPAALAAAESAAFRNEIGCNLPEGDVQIITGQVPIEGGSPCNVSMQAVTGTVTISVRWRDARGDAQTGGNAQFECYNLSMRIR